MRRAVRLVVAAVALGALVFLFVLPARVWLEQSRAMGTAERRSAVLAHENQILSQRAKQLQQPSYLEQVARQQYGLVMPGEQAYGILLPTATTTTVAPGG